jgi:hypothetical protein
MKKIAKAKSGTSLGMKSVKAGYDKNPGVTRADIISAATGKAKNGTKVVGKKPIKKAQGGTEVDPFPISTARRARAVKEADYEDFFQKTSRAKKGEDYASSRYYGGAFTPSKVLERHNPYRFESPSKAGITKKPNVTKTAAPSKDAIKAYKKSAPKAKKGIVIKKMKTGGKCKNGC